MNKRGQFYLIAAVVIISLIISLVLVTNYSQKTENVRVYDLAEELKIESGKTLDLGAITGTYRWNELTQNYSSYAGNDIRIVFIVGNSSIQDVFKYDNGVKNTTIPRIFVPGNPGNLTITVDGTNYIFKIRAGQNFYFIMSQNIGEERYVATN